MVRGQGLISGKKKVRLKPGIYVTKVNGVFIRGGTEPRLEPKFRLGVNKLKARSSFFLSLPNILFQS